MTERVRDQEADRLRLLAYHARQREIRTAHINRWLDAGMTVEEIVFACGYHPRTVEAVLASRDC